LQLQQRRLHPVELELGEEEEGEEQVDQPPMH